MQRRFALTGVAIYYFLVAAWYAVQAASYGLNRPLPLSGRVIADCMFSIQPASWFVLLFVTAINAMWPNAGWTFPPASVFAVLSCVAAAVGLGVWRIRQWGRVIAVVLSGTSFVFSLANSFFAVFLVSDPVRGIALARNVLLLVLVLGTHGSIVWYLTRPQVKATFRPLSREEIEAAKKVRTKWVVIFIVASIILPILMSILLLWILASWMPHI